MASDVGEAFRIVLDFLTDELQRKRDAAAHAARRGDTEAARDLLDRCETLERVVNALGDAEALLPAAGRNREPGQEAPPPRMPRGSRTPNAAYRLPILRSLVTRGGSGKLKEVLDDVYREMAEQLKPADMEPVTSGEIRWRKAARWERQLMVEERLLARDSPHGLWVITDQGREYLAARDITRQRQP